MSEPLLHSSTSKAAGSHWLYGVKEQGNKPDMQTLLIRTNRIIQEPPLPCGQSECNKLAPIDPKLLSRRGRTPAILFLSCSLLCALLCAWQSREDERSGPCTKASSRSLTWPLLIHSRDSPPPPHIHALRRPQQELQ